MSASRYEQGRFFLKDLARSTVDFAATDQALGRPPPPMQNPAPPGVEPIALPGPVGWTRVRPVPLLDAMRRRASRRRFRPEPMELEEVAFLLWATQGVHRILNPAVSLRTVPSAGARHPFETYVAALSVNGLTAGLYRYLPLDHRLVPLERVEARQLAPRLVRACLGQFFVGRAAAVFVWTAVPARTEWRYGAAAHKVIALDAGHVMQNLYLACEAVDAATCAIAAYDQTAMDRLLGVDGEDEFTVYLAPVGRRAEDSADGA